MNLCFGDSGPASSNKRWSEPDFASDTKFVPGQTTLIASGVWRRFGRKQGKNVDRQSKRKTEV